MLLRYFLLLSISICPLIKADLKEDMRKLLDEVAEAYNATGPTVYQSQKAGYATGGGLTIRNKSVNVRPLTFTMPKIDAGCGGIDIYTGGLSFVKEEEIVQTLRSILSSAGGYSFLLSLQSVSPQIANTVQQLQSWANQINNLNINSCEVAAGLVGSVWPKNEMTSQHICQTVGTNLGFITDRVNSRHECGTKESRKIHQEDIKKSHPEYNYDYNVAWKALQYQSSLAKENAELFMTLMGTITVHDEKVEVYPPKALEEGFLRKLMDGGELKLYKCENDKIKQCLIIKEESKTFDSKEAWVSKIAKHLNDIQLKILKDEELDDKEIELMMETRIPLWRYICMMTAYKKSVCPIDTQQIAEVVALDLLAKFLRDTLDSIRISCLKLKQEVPFAEKIDDYLASLEFVERSISQHELRSTRLMEQENSIFKKMDLIEKYIAQELHL